MVGEATDNLLDNSNDPFILSRVDHVPVDTFYLDLHQPFVDVENPPVFVGKTRSSFGGPELFYRTIRFAGE